MGKRYYRKIWCQVGTKVITENDITLLLKEKCSEMKRLLLAKINILSMKNGVATLIKGIDYGRVVVQHVDETGNPIKTDDTLLKN